MNNRISEFHDKGGFHSGRAPREVLKQAMTLVDYGQRVESVNYLRESIRNYPSDIFLHMNASVTLTKLGDDMERRGNFEAADEYWNLSLDYALCGLKINADDVRLLTHAGKTMRKLKEFEDSEAMYMRALSVNDRDKFTWSALGELYARWADQPDENRDDMLQDCVDCYSEALWLDPADHVAQEKINDLSSRGYLVSDEGYDMGDYDLDDGDALDIIAQHEIKDPSDLPVVPAMPVIPHSSRDDRYEWRPRLDRG